MIKLGKHILLLIIDSSEEHNSCVPLNLLENSSMASKFVLSFASLSPLDQLIQIFLPKKIHINHKKMLLIMYAKLHQNHQNISFLYVMDVPHIPTYMELLSKKF